MKPQTFIFAGIAGSGKGTQVALLREYLRRKYPADEMFYFYAGDGFRSFIKTEGFTASLCRKTLEVGGLQPEFLAIWLWADAFIKGFKGTEHVFIDGSPRKLVEAEALDSALRFYKRAKPAVIVLSLTPERAAERLFRRGRHDDTKEAIKERLDWYETNVVPAVAFFRKNPDYRVIDIDSDHPIEDVHKKIVEAIGM